MNAGVDALTSFPSALAVSKATLTDLRNRHQAGSGPARWFAHNDDDCDKDDRV